MPKFDVEAVEALVRRIRSGDSAAEEEFVAHCAGPLVAYCEWELSPAERDAAGYVAWLALSKVQKKIHEKPDEPATTVAYLMTTARRTIADHYRSVGWLPREVPLHEQEHPDAHTSAPECDNGARIALIHDAAHALTERQRKVLFDYFAGLSASESAKKIGCKPKAVTRVRGYLGLPDLRKKRGRDDPPLQLDPARPISRAVIALYLVRYSECPHVGLPAGNAGRLESIKLCDEVIAHADTCEACRKARKNALAALAGVLGLLFLPALTPTTADIRLVNAEQNPEPRVGGRALSAAAVALWLAAAFVLVQRDQPRPAVVAFQPLPAVSQTATTSSAQPPPATSTTTAPPVVTTTRSPVKPSPPGKSKVAVPPTTTTTSTTTSATTSTTLPATKLTLTVGADSDGWMKVTIGGTAATCGTVAGTPAVCSYTPPHGAKVRLDPVELVPRWGPGPCATTPPEEACTFIASTTVSLTVDVFRKL